MKKTVWFPKSVKPVRVGVYEVKGTEFDFDGDGGNYRYWDGKMWSYTRHSASAFFCNNSAPYYKHNKSLSHWRGVVKGK